MPNSEETRMRPTAVDLAGFKGSSGRYALGPVTLVTGANGSGKTAFLSAIVQTLNPSRGFPWLAEGGASVAAVVEFDSFTVQRPFSPEHAAAMVPGPTGIALDALPAGALDGVTVIRLTRDDAAVARAESAV